MPRLYQPVAGKGRDNPPTDQHDQHDPCCQPDAQPNTPCRIKPLRRFPVKDRIAKDQDR
jgi:hypothetical protein